MRTRTFASLVVVCLVVVITLAQGNGIVAGVVVDAHGAPLVGVTVTLEGSGRRTAVTNQRGEFEFAGVQPGSYRLQFSLTGFSPLSAEVRVVAGTNPPNTYAMVTADANTSAAPLAIGESPSPRPEDAAKRSGVAGGIGGGVVGGVTGGIPSAPPPPATRSIRVGGHLPRPYPSLGGESYAGIDENAFVAVAREPLSTFSIDVDTASYSNVRRFLSAGTLPPADAVRIEEMINYFRYRYPQPADAEPFSVTTELTDCPWNPNHRLALIALQGRHLPVDDQPARNLVFLIDVSGSMQSVDKLPLVRNALRMFSDTLSARDRVAIVVYAGSSGLVLPSVPGDHRGAIHRAIADLEAGGSTNGGQGIQLAYHVARANFLTGGINRVILATDGDFNVGMTSQAALVDLIERERASGVFLSVLGVGTGNLKDSTMELLADKGNGNYAYLDSLHEARKVLITEGGSTLVTIAKDVKLQLEFNPRHVAGYRLIGYENRLLRPEDFNNDKKDAGEIGAGHTVTALYEIVPAGTDLPGLSIDPLKYQTPERPGTSMSAAASGELLTVKLRYKQPTADESQLMSRVIRNQVQPMSANVGFASAVAEIGMLLRDSPYAPSASFAAAIARARKFRGADDDGYRMEFIKLAEGAASLRRLQQVTPH